MSRYGALHADSGPGDARPTALQIVRDEASGDKLKGKMAIITGASSGIGVETARAMHEAGVGLYLAVRNIEQGKEIAKQLKASAASIASDAPIDVLKLELDSLQSVRHFAEQFLKKNQALNILVCNAGVMATPEGQTKDGFETQFGINHLGHFLLFQLLKPCLLASASLSFPSRVVFVSSLGHRMSPIHFSDLDLKQQGYNKWTAYGQSKTANIYLANEIERRYGSQGLHATSVHPGTIVDTNLSRHLDEEQRAQFRTPAFQKILKSTEQGAATSVWAAIGREWEDKGGVYLEDCSISTPVDVPEPTLLDKGYGLHAYDQEAAEKLWDLSEKLVGFTRAH